MRALLPLAALGLVLAGCIGGGAPADLAPAEAPFGADGAETGQVLVASQGCVEGGGHSNYNKAGFEGRDILPEPWEPADVREDIGNPKVTSAFPFAVLPEHTLASGEQVGNYHTTVTCEAWSLDGEPQGGTLNYGFVGIRVEPPPFDPGGAAKHYLIVLFSVQEAPLLDLIHGAEFHASKGKIVTEFLDVAAKEVYHTVLDDEHHGVYETHVELFEMGPLEPGVTRLWMIHGDEERGYTPFALDLRSEGGTHLYNEGDGWFSHTRTEDHARFMGLPPGAWGHIPALGYRDFDRTITMGPRPDVVLEEPYIHL